MGKGEIPISRRSIEFLQHNFLNYIRQFLDLFQRADILDHVDFHERHFCRM